MCDKKPKRVHKSAGERQTEILLAASQVFAERGYQVARMQAVADAVGISVGTIYRYFETKEALFMETLRYNLEALRQSVEAARRLPEDPLEQLREGMRAYLVFLNKTPTWSNCSFRSVPSFARSGKPLCISHT